ncbi:MAG: cytochrome c peroxidase [Saprospiraceae bacterium]
MITFFPIYSCVDDEKDMGDLTQYSYAPQNYELRLPAHFPNMVIPTDNPLTDQGILLGRHLFYDPILSGDSTMSCASCHLPELGFADGKAVSTGIDNIAGTRSSMSLINIGFVRSGLFWDGRAKTLEDQSLIPVEDPIELHTTWPEVINKLQVHSRYPKMFREAFGIQNKSEITKELAAKAIAQFERIMISKDSKFDKVQEGKAFYTDLELIGFGLYFDDDPDLPDTECGHCHNIPMATSDDFFNNGLTETGSLDGFPDNGRGKVTGSRADNGKFRAPTLRNIKYTAPYMHDGRFQTIDEVINHYKSGGKKSPNADPLLHPLAINQFYINALKAFIDTFNDTTFYSNPELKNPFN